MHVLKSFYYLELVEQDENFNFFDEDFWDTWCKKKENYQNIREVLVHMAVCHTVIKDANGKFSGPSSDEVALVHAAKKLEVEFL